MSADMEMEQQHRSGLHSSELSAWHNTELRAAELLASLHMPLAIACMAPKHPISPCMTDASLAKQIPEDCRDLLKAGLLN